MGSQESGKQITLFSETDIFGTILFVNEAFCEVSQFSIDELLGYPHNIIRHPDMPKKLFKVLWRTIKNEMTFRGIIKNKAKDGSSYWERTTIMPMFDNRTHTTKLIAVHHLIADSEIAQELYDQQMRSLDFNLSNSSRQTAN